MSARSKVAAAALRDHHDGARRLYMHDADVARELNKYRPVPKMWGAADDATRASYLSEALHIDAALSACKNDPNRRHAAAMYLTTTDPVTSAMNHTAGYWSRRIEIYEGEGGRV